MYRNRLLCRSSHGSELNEKDNQRQRQQDVNHALAETYDSDQQTQSGNN
jgi:hypothetical protein